MPHPYLRNIFLTIPGSPVVRTTGGSLAFGDDRLVLVDNNTGEPKLYIFDINGAYQRVLSLPVQSTGYTGATFLGSSLVLLSPLTLVCTIGFDVARLTSVNILTGEIVGTQDVRFDRVLLNQQGLVRTNDGLLFTGIFNNQKAFYRIRNNRVSHVADFSLSGTGYSLGYDGNYVYVANQTDRLYAYHDRSFVRDAAEDISLSSPANKAYGLAWTGAALGVLEVSPLGVHFYGTSTPTPTPGQISTGSGRQLFKHGHLLENFTAGAQTFKAVFSERVVREPVTINGITQIVNRDVITVTPEFLLNGVRSGSIFVGPDGTRMKVDDIIRVGTSYRQAFRCSRED